jgi:hypothetical protein
MSSGMRYTSDDGGLAKYGFISVCLSIFAAEIRRSLGWRMSMPYLSKKQSRATVSTEAHGTQLPRLLPLHIVIFVCGKRWLGWS